MKWAHDTFQFGTNTTKGKEYQLFGHSEAKRIIKKTMDETIFRSHFNYRSSDVPWHDWVSTKWTGFDDLYPAKILFMFQIRVPNIPREEAVEKLSLTPEQFKVYDIPLCLVHCTEKQTKAQRAHTVTGDTLLTKKLRLEYKKVRNKDYFIPVLHVLDMKAIEDHVLVVQHKPGMKEKIYNRGDSTVTMIADREKEWGKRFLDFNNDD